MKHSKIDRNLPEMINNLKAMTDDGIKHQVDEIVLSECKDLIDAVDETIEIPAFPP